MKVQEKVKNRLEKRLQEAPRNSKLGKWKLRSGVRFSQEFSRIRELPIRDWVHLVSSEELPEKLTAVLKRDQGTMALREVQAAALYEMIVNKGMFCSVRVGGGKTLISLLAPYVLDAQRCLLIVPAKLKEKTIRECAVLSNHWLIPYNVIKVESYEKIGRPSGAELLSSYRPDLIVCDEVHKLKNKKAAVTKRVSRYMKELPDTMFVALSGTVTKRSIKDYSHLMNWCLGEGSPLPRSYQETEEWALAVDEGVDPMKRLKPGALSFFINADKRPEKESKEEELQRVRNALKLRISTTPGVITTEETFEGASLVIQGVPVPIPNMESYLNLLYQDWETPDGMALADAMQVYRHARELALGFFYRWNPRPPESWIEARKLWSKSVRDVLSRNRRGLDSEFMVAKAIRDGEYPELLGVYEDWVLQKSAFGKPNTEAVWISDDVINWVIDWSSKNIGIIWVEHTAFGERLSEKSGLPYYHKQGMNKHRQYIEDASNSSIIASINSNAEGRNLQHKWNNNLVVSCEPNGQKWEQMIGRTHREGQPADEVNFTFIVSILGHLVAFNKACQDAKYVQDTTGQVQKLLYSDVLLPDEKKIFSTNDKVVL